MRQGPQNPKEAARFVVGIVRSRLWDRRAHRSGSPLAKFETDEGIRDPYPIHEQVRALGRVPAGRSAASPRPRAPPNRDRRPVRQRTIRAAYDDTELGGHPVPKSTWVVGLIGGANRDPAVFEAPGEFRIDRYAD